MTLSRRQAMLLAALLDADGAVVPYAVLGDLVGASGAYDNAALRTYVRRLEALDLDCVEVVKGRGLRLTTVPPDWTLETVLVMLDALRRDGYGAVVTLRRTA
jgi:hypothetical protein